MKIFQIQRGSAVLLLFFFVMHIVIMHYGFPLQEVNYENTITRMQSPVWKGIEIAFLFSVILHGLAGAYAVLTDYDKIAKFKKVIGVVLFAVGLWALYIGTMTVLSWGS